MNIEIKPRFNSFSHRMPAGHSILAADASFVRADGRFSGLGLHLQASCLTGEASPHPDDANMFYQAVALLSAAPDLLAALILARETIATALKANAPDWFQTDADVANHIAIKKIDSAIAKATTHPLHDEMAAREIAYEESQEMARARAAERADHDEERDYIAEDSDAERAQEAADFNREAANDTRLLGGAA